MGGERPVLDDEMRAYLRAEIARRRAQQARTCRFPAKVAALPEPASEPSVVREAWHGTDNGYKNKGCRCDDCREAQRVATRRYSRRKRAEAIALSLDTLEPPAMFIATALVVGHTDLGEIAATSRLPAETCAEFDRKMRANGLWTPDGKWLFGSLDDDGRATEAAGVELAMHMLVAEGELVRVRA